MNRIPETQAPVQATTLRELSPQQWRSGAAAWLGWMFDGLDMHLYTLVALPFVAQLLGGLDPKDPAVSTYSSYIQFAFLMGWALGGGVFGRLGDRLGRSRTLMLTILTYACFTGLSYFAETWWQLFICRFLAALGIGGEWAVGAALLAETWPRSWRPWLAAVLQSAVNVGVMLATLAGWLLAGHEPRTVFLVGLLPALFTLWIRFAVPETAEWHAAKATASGPAPGIAALFHGAVRRITLLTLVVCALSLTAHWAFMFWYLQHLRQLPEVLAWSDAERTRMASGAMLLLMIASVLGNFVAAAVARRLGYRLAIVLAFLAYGVAMLWCYANARTLSGLWPFLAAIGLCQGVFALFTMYLPPLFPVLVRTTGAGFCYNIGRIAAAFGVVVFGALAPVGDIRLALLYAGMLFIPAAAFAWFLPEPPDAVPVDG
jgi:MFS family permease